MGTGSDPRLAVATLVLLSSLPELAQFLGKAVMMGLGSTRKLHYCNLNWLLSDQNKCAQTAFYIILNDTGLDSHLKLYQCSFLICLRLYTQSSEGVFRFQLSLGELLPKELQR